MAKEFRVVWEMQLDAENPLEAAKKAQEWLRDPSTDWQFYIQSEGKKKNEVFSVDLTEEDEDAVLKIDNYVPLIKES